MFAISNPKYKLFVPEGFYHVYNRGVEKRAIFLSDQDIFKFYDLLSTYLSPEYNPQMLSHKIAPRKRYEERINIHAYCLMGNHFHLLIQQEDINALSEFMHSICTAYTMYFNKKYIRVGPLFQGRFCAKLITDQYSFQNVKNYIHENPVADFAADQSSKDKDITNRKMIEAQSSYKYYIGIAANKPSWLKLL